MNHDDTDGNTGSDDEWPSEWKVGKDGIKRYQVEIAQIPEWTTDEEGLRLPKAIVTEGKTYYIQDVSMIGLGGKKTFLKEGSKRDVDARSNTEVLNDFFLNTLKSSDTLIFPKDTTYYFTPGLVLSGSLNKNTTTKIPYD